MLIYCVTILILLLEICVSFIFHVFVLQMELWEFGNHHLCYCVTFPFEIQIKKYHGCMWYNVNRPFPAQDVILAGLFSKEMIYHESEFTNS